MTNAVSRIFYLVPNTFWKNVHRFWSKKDGILGSICNFEDRIACTSAKTNFFEQQKILDLVFWYNYLRFTAILNRCTHVRSRAVTKILDNVATFSWILAQNSEWTDAGAGHATLGWILRPAPVGADNVPELPEALMVSIQTLQTKYFWKLF